MTVTSDPISIDGKSFVTKTDGDKATVVRTATGTPLTQGEIDTAGNFYDSDTNTIDYAEIYDLNFGPNFIDQKGASNEWMSEALSNKLYKNAFKQATGKSGPNLSFASAIQAGNNWASTPLNTSANNSPTSGGKFIGRYPLNQDKKQYDYLQVTAHKYEPAKFSGAEGSGSSITEEAEKRGMIPEGYVFLPMQPGLADNTSVGWGEDQLNAIEAAMANITGSAVTGASKGLDEAAKAFGGATKEGLKLLGGVKTEDLAGYFAKQATGKNVLTRTTGKVMNPNLELLFTGPSLRSFNYNFKFTPREAREAKMVRQIIRFFKKNMVPKRDDTNLFLKSPNVFKLKYVFKEGGQHPFLNKIKMCALRSMDVQYTPDGSYMTYDDGSMTSYSISLSFGELNPIYDTDFEGSENDMGF